MGNLEVEVVDIRLVEDVRGAQQDRVVRGDGVLTQLASGEGLARCISDRLTRQLCRCIAS